MEGRETMLLKHRINRAANKRKQTNRLRFGPVILLLLSLGVGLAAAQGTEADWRQATPKELQALLPARATVVKEHIETEMRTASGMTDGHGRFIAGVVLITAGYSADGKYSHYFVVQVPLQVGQLSLAPGDYVFGWRRDGDTLVVHFYDAATGALRGDAKATRIEGDTRVESFKIWPMQSKSLIQIGRFGIPYHLQK
jgi:hypothetical protein